ncbi:putative 2-amino-3-carboxymuconate-6-semialdehyde decarboxylase [Trichoderma velutinum]
MTILVSLEDHFLSPTVQAWQANQSTHRPGPRVGIFSLDLQRKFKSLGEERLADMKKAGVNLQVVCHGPTRRNPPAAICCVSKRERRLKGFAMLPMEELVAAALELNRCVKELSFVGALINNLSDGGYYDDKRYWPVFDKAQELDVPIYIHPAYPSEAMLERYNGNFPLGVANALSAWGWGWHSETALHILRLFASGLFDQYPRLKIIIGHDGEMLPFQFDRILPISTTWGATRSLKGVWDENIWVTTSGMFSIIPFACLFKVSQKDRILFSVDYPFAKCEQGVEFMNEVKRKGLLTTEEFDMVAYKNASKLLKFDVPEV